MIAKMLDAKFKVTLACGKVHDILVQQGLDNALNEKMHKPTTMMVDDQEGLKLQVVSMIGLSPEDEVLYNIPGENSAAYWKSLRVCT